MKERERERQTDIDMQASRQADRQTERGCKLEVMYLAFTHMPGESYRRRFRSLLLYLCYVYRELVNSLVC